MEFRPYEWMLFGLLVGWGRVYQDYLWVTKSLANPPLRILGIAIVHSSTIYYFLSSLLCKSRNCFSTFSAIGKSPNVVYPSFAIRKYFIASRLFLIAE